MRCHVDDCTEPAMYRSRLDWTAQPEVLLCIEHAAAAREWGSVLSISSTADMKCAACGTDPAAGYATAYQNGAQVRLCHSDEQRPSCYERRFYWPPEAKAGSTTGGAATRQRTSVTWAVRLFLRGSPASMIDRRGLQ